MKIDIKKQIFLFLLSVWGARMLRKAMTSKKTDIEYLARTAWGEARNQGVPGMQAVINVIMNRVKKGIWWGDTVQDVVLKPWQFSVWNEDNENSRAMKEVTLDDYQYKVAYELAEKAVNGQLEDITNGATHYHTVYVNPSWASELTYLGTIGNHKFYA